MLKTLALFVLSAATLVNAANASATWFDLVSPILTRAEKKTYLALNPADREKFEENFWTGKSITQEEYFKRIQYIDAQFGGTKPGSGANTDQGRVYLAIGPPTKITRLPSSRIFVPIEIWYYDIVPGVLNTELRLIFYQKNVMGFPKLYSPTLDTIRVLLLPEAATYGMFGPNDEITEADIRNNLNVPPAEDEVISAAVNVATGIKYSGNDEILGQISSPEAMLRRPPQTRVTSRFMVYRPKLDTIATPSEYGGSQIDFNLETTARHQVGIEVLGDRVPIYQNQLALNFTKPQPIHYTHRLDLLPGTYTVIFKVDEKAYPYPLQVKPQAAISEIFRTDPGVDTDVRKTPFEFQGKQVHLNPNGPYIAIALSQPEKVTWILRRGAEVFWKYTSDPQLFVMAELPPTGLAPGSYQLEAVTPTASRTTEIIIGPKNSKDAGSKDTKDDPEATVISFNANLAPALRLAFIGHQWLLRGNLAEARKSLDASLTKGATFESMIELARVDVMAGRLDEARDRVRRVLAARPDDFQALSVLAVIETKFQDYPVAAELYRRALAVQDSPELRSALAQLPKQ